MYKIAKNGFLIAESFKVQLDAVKHLRVILNSLKHASIISDIEIYDQDTHDVYKVEASGKIDTYHRIND